MIKVLYHAGCFDGFCAAWLCSKVMGPDAEYIPVQYGTMFPSFESEDEVFIVDFCYPFDDAIVDGLTDIANKVQCLTIIDHHKSAKDALEGIKLPGNSEVIFDMEKSGARLVQEYFKLPAHWLIDYTEDRDLWRWSLGNSKEVNAGLRLFEMDFHVWDKLVLAEVEQAGVLLNKYLTRKCEALAKKATTHRLCGTGIQAVNCTDADLISETAGMLAEQSEIGIGATFFYDGENNVYVYSLRSRKDTDCLYMAKHYGGGGHPKACGFSVKELLNGH